MPTVVLVHRDTRVHLLVQKTIALAGQSGLPLRAVDADSIAQAVTVVRGDVLVCVIVDPWHGGGLTADDIVQILRHGPLCSVIAVAPGGSGTFGEVAALARAGVSAWLTLGLDDTPQRLLSEILVHFGKTIIGNVLIRVRQKADPLVIQLIHVVLEAGSSPLRVATLAKRLARSERTLRRHLEYRGLPAPAWWIRWGRAVTALALLDEVGLTADQVSRRLRLGATSNLWRLLRQISGARHPPLEALVDLAIEALDRN